MGARWGRLGFPAGVSTLLGALVGALTNLATAGWSWGLSAGLAVAVGCWTVWEVRLRGGEQRAAAVQARDRVLVSLVRAETGEVGAFGLLVADRRVVPLQGRRGESELLREWCDGDDSAGVLVLSGPAGVGKTRLGLEFGLQLPSPWAAGWLRPGQAAAVLPAIVDCGDPALIVVDDADTRAEVASLLDALAGHGGQPRVRLLLIARDGDALLTGLRPLVADAARWLVQAARVVPVGPHGRAGDRERWFALAVGRFARERGVLAPSAATLAGAVGADDETMLALQARALLTVLAAPQRSGGVAAVRRLPVGRVIAELFAHEQAWWEASAAVERWGLSGLTAETRERGVLALALCGASDEDAAVRAVRRVPDLADAAEVQVRNVARWVEGLYPAAGGGVRIKPDLFGDWFIADRLTRQPKLAAALVSGMDGTEWRWALAVLTRTAGAFPAVLPVLAQLWQAAGDDVDVVIRLLLVHHTVQLDEQFAAFVDAVGLPVAALESLDEQLPAYELPRSKAAVARRLVAGYRTLAADNPAHQPALARALNNLGIRLSALGAHRPALEAASEAVTLYRVLAADNPAHQPDLARALNNLGSDLSAVGERRPAHEATSEAVTLWRALAADNPAHQPDLARTLNNLGIRLSALGAHRPAHEATSEAVTLWRASAADNPADQPDLARALNNLGSDLSAVGEHRSAHEATSEAVTLWRALAADNPAHQPDLAGTLNNLGIRLAALGEHRPAYEATSEAVTLRRALAADNPAHQPNLATALNNLGVRFSAVGEHRQAHEATSEAVTLHRALAADNPAHQPDLANALNSLGGHLSALGERRPAYEATSEAVTLWRALAADNPAHQPDLARALNNLGIRLSALGEHRPAYEATSEAVTLWRALAADNPAHQPDLANGLNNLGSDLCELGKHDDEFRFRREALKLFKTLAERDVDLYGARYQRALANLQTVYVRHGHEDLAARLGIPPKPRASSDLEGQPRRSARQDPSPRHD